MTRGHKCCDATPPRPAVCAPRPPPTDLPSSSPRGFNLFKFRVHSSSRAPRQFKRKIRKWKRAASSQSRRLALVAAALRKPSKIPDFSLVFEPRCRPAPSKVCVGNYNDAAESFLHTQLIEGGRDFITSSRKGAIQVLPKLINERGGGAELT